VGLFTVVSERTKRFDDVVEWRQSGVVTWQSGRAQLCNATVARDGRQLRRNGPFACLVRARAWGGLAFVARLLLFLWTTQGLRPTY